MQTRRLRIRNRHSVCKCFHLSSFLYSNDNKISHYLFSNISKSKVYKNSPGWQEKCKVGTHTHTHTPNTSTVLTSRRPTLMTVKPEWHQKPRSWRKSTLIRICNASIFFSSLCSSSQSPKPDSILVLLYRWSEELKVCNDVWKFVRNGIEEMKDGEINMIDRKMKYAQEYGNEWGASEVTRMNKER